MVETFRELYWGGLESKRAKAEQKTIERVSSNELRLLNAMNLIQEPLAEVAVNPNLTIFLDGPDGLGGYADVLMSKVEYL